MNKIFLLAMFLVGLLLVGSVTAATYYVSTTGSDSNSGTQAAPWKTITKAKSMLQPGQTVIVKSGIYNERVTVSGGKSGTITAPIVYQAEEGVVMGGFIVYDNYTKIINFNIINSTGAGIQILGHYNTISDNYIYNPAGIGIEIGSHGTNWEKDSLMYSRGTNNIVSNNTIVHAITAGITTYGEKNIIEYNDISRTYSGPIATGNEDADGLRFHGRSHIIRGNYIHDINHNESPTAHSDCFQSWGPAYNILFEYNVCYLPIFEFQGMMLEQEADPNKYSPVENITFRYNIWRFSRPGMSYAPGLNIGYNIKNVIVEHNTFIRDIPGMYALWFKNDTGVIIKDNIFYNGIGGEYPDNKNNIAANIWREYMSATEITADYNLVYRSDGILLTAVSQTKGVPKGAHDIWNINPTFNDLNGLDYRPKATLANGSANPVCTGSSTGSYIGALPCVGSSSYHVADTNNDMCISLGEISAYVSKWLQGSVTLSQTSNAVSEWLGGC